MRWQGFAVGFLGLTLLQVVVSNPQASGRVGGLAAGVGKLAEKLLSPTVPVFGPAPTQGNTDSATTAAAGSPQSANAAERGQTIAGAVIPPGVLATSIPGHPGKGAAL